MQTAPQIGRFNFFGGTSKPSRFGRSYWFWNHLGGSIRSTVDRLKFPQEIVGIAKEGNQACKRSSCWRSTTGQSQMIEGILRFIHKMKSIAMRDDSKVGVSYI